jgi:hypothetical protein
MGMGMDKGKGKEMNYARALILFSNSVYMGESRKGWSTKLALEMEN